MRVKDNLTIEPNDRMKYPVASWRRPAYFVKNIAVVTIESAP